MKLILPTTLALFALLTGSCATNTGTGLIAGTVFGASIGGMSAGGKGALIGGAAGVIAGGLIGAALDSQDRQVLLKSSPRTVDRMDRGEPLTINDIIKLSQGGVTDDTIMDYIEEKGTSYHLSQAQVRRMQDAGVSQRVINYMIQTGQ